MFLDNHFLLMNKDRQLATFVCLRNEYQDLSFEIVETFEELPHWMSDLGKWIENRRAPKHRKHIESLLRKIGCYDLEGFVRLTHALTLNDSFWIKPENSDLKWENVSLFRNEFDETIAHIAFEGGLYGEQFTSTSPEFGTDGAFAKCWIREPDGIYLMKQGSEGARNAGLEPYSEMYASQLAKEICRDYVPYSTVMYRGKLASKCKLFTSESKGFLPAYRCMENGNGIAGILRFFSAIGSEEDFRRMVVLDALTLNTDRHMGNYGILYDTDTYEPIKMAPVFDNNQALLPYAEKEDFGKNRAEYLASRPPRIGNDFNAVAHSMLTPAIRADLLNLKGFRFDRNVSYPLPTERLEQLEQIIDFQIDNVLDEKKLYIAQSAEAVMKECMKQTAERHPKSILDKNQER